MRQNERTVVGGEVVRLVPYSRRHVLKYHGWMQSEELLDLTASERLTLEKEYEMQRSWREDADKCTFIVLGADDAGGPAVSEGAAPAEPAPDVAEAHQGGAAPALPAIAAAADAGEHREVAAMVGDVNLFLNDPHEPKTAEIDVMIAEPSARGRGMGREAVLLMMHYGVTQLKLTKFVAKIALTNTPSLGLFGKLGFSTVSECEEFGEATLELAVAPVPPALARIWAAVPPVYGTYTLGDH
mmetsp:Transcript_28393/g.74579  ORF Transcript_28393/g.74579 Transcript_28393/m.74579 type:complete len:241 (-) Transcript_28393:1385-2107(-)